METIINALQGASLRGSQRVDAPSPASKRQNEKVTRSSGSQLEQQPEAAEVREAADRLSNALQALKRDLAISVHEDSGKLVVEVKDPKTGEVLRQIPPERMLEVEESIDRIVGLFVNDTA